MKRYEKHPAKHNDPTTTQTSGKAMSAAHICTKKSCTFGKHAGDGACILRLHNELREPAALFPNKPHNRPLKRESWWISVISRSRSPAPPKGQKTSSCPARARWPSSRSGQAGTRCCSHVLTCERISLGAWPVEVQASSDKAPRMSTPSDACLHATRTCSRV